MGSLADGDDEEESKDGDRGVRRAVDFSPTATNGEASGLGGGGGGGGGGFRGADVTRVVGVERRCVGGVWSSFRIFLDGISPAEGEGRGPLARGVVLDRAAEGRRVASVVGVVEVTVVLEAITVRVVPVLLARVGGGGVLVTSDGFFPTVVRGGVQAGMVRPVSPLLVGCVVASTTREAVGDTMGDVRVTREPEEAAEREEREVPRGREVACETGVGESRAVGESPPW